MNVIFDCETTCNSNDITDSFKLHLAGHNNAPSRKTSMSMISSPSFPAE